MANPEVFRLTADVITVVSSSDYVHLNASGSMNIRRMKQKNLYNRLVNGLVVRPEVGEAPINALISQEMQIVTASVNDTATTSKFVRIFGAVTGSNGQLTILTGGLFPVSSSVFRYGEEPATVPSWTQVPIGKHHAFVMTPFSSSDHEVSRLNAFSSGVLALEVSPVPASASVYYSKATRLVRRIYKLSASLDLPVNPPDIEQFPFDQEILVARPVFDSTSGSFRAYSYFNPAIFEIDVPDYGRIRDVKVWVEFVHDVRIGTGTVGSVGTEVRQGLGGVQVALRSPNVSFRAAHPLWNDPQLANFGFRPSQNLTGAIGQFGGKYNQIPELLRSSYLLWAGHQVEADDVSATTNYGDGINYISWNTDIDMRTVFWDASPTLNTKHTDLLFPNSTDVDPGTSPFTGSAESLLSGALSGGAPNNKAFSIDSTACSFGDSGPSARGKGAPWVLDTRLKAGSISSPGSLTAVLGTSPPPGWLTGPGGSNDVGEFLTAGPNLGPNNIRPVYPLLDDVFVSKIYDKPASAGGDSYALPTVHPKIVGFRPGLRGTEIHGKWQLLIGNFADFDAFQGFLANRRSGIWFRQFRLEFIIDQGPEVESFYPSKNLRFKRPAYVPQKDGRRRIQIMSGTSNWDIGVDYVQTQVRQDYGRTIGITSDVNASLEDPAISGSTFQDQMRLQGGVGLDSFAVYTRITGSLADYLSGSFFTFGAFHTYLHNEFGTPFIPITSGSGVTPSFETFDPQEAEATRDVIKQIFHTQPDIHVQDTIDTYISRNDIIQSRSSLMERLVNPSILRNISFRDA